MKQGTPYFLVGLVGFLVTSSLYVGAVGNSPDEPPSEKFGLGATSDCPTRCDVALQETSRGSSNMVLLETAIHGPFGSIFGLRMTAPSLRVAEATREDTAMTESLSPEQGPSEAAVGAPAENVALKGLEHRATQSQFQSTQVGVLTERTITFDVGSAVVSPAAMKTLDELISQGRSKRILSIDLIGHADSVGAEDSNLRLSWRRADAARHYLSDNGFPAERLSAIGYGSALPVAEGMNHRSHRMNRRVEIKLLENE